MTDRYTKTILTLIALCLMWISVDGPALFRERAPVAPSMSRTVDVNIAEVGGKPVTCGFGCSRTD